MVMALDPGNKGGVGVDVGETYDYAYPFGLDLRPGSELHQLIVGEVLGRARDSKSVMSGRYDSWKRVDQTLTAYAPANEAFNQNLGKSDEVEVIVPMGYATMDTLLSHWLSEFTGGVFFPLKGVGPEDKGAAMLMELVMDLQFQRKQMLLNMHTQYRDAISYGMGIVGTGWKRDWGKKISLRAGGEFSPALGSFLENATSERVIEEGIIWEGNELQNWSVYGYLPDPNRPVHEVQKMHFVGNSRKSDYYELLEMEEHGEGSYFNVRYLDGAGDMVSEMLESGEWANGIRDSQLSGTSRRRDVVSMYCKLVPAKWGLGKNEYPEIWLFEVAGDRMLIRAEPVDFAHNNYPVTVCAPTYDGFTTAPTSIIEMVLPLLDTLDWYFRSHFHNVRKSLNNMFLIDPYLVNYSQAANPEPGKMICMREHVWGRGVKDAMQQLATSDVTKNNINDIAATIDILQRATGAVDQLQGVTQTKGERRSATESRDTRTSALARVSKQALLAGMMANRNISRQFMFNNQQFLQDPMYVDLIGRNQAELRYMYGDEGEGEGQLLVTPDMLVGDMDIVSEDPAGEGGEFLNEAMQLYSMASTGQETFMAFDSVKMMLNLMRMSGSKNPTQFLREGFKMTVMPNEEALEQANEQGMVPVNGDERPKVEQEAQAKAPGTEYSDLVQGALGNG